MILRNNNILCGTPIYPWSIRTFFAFAAAEGILLDLVILEWSSNRGGGEEVSRFQISVVGSRSQLVARADADECGEGDH